MTKSLITYWKAGRNTKSSRLARQIHLGFTIDEIQQLDALPARPSARAVYYATDPSPKIRALCVKALRRGATSTVIKEIRGLNNRTRSADPSTLRSELTRQLEQALYTADRLVQRTDGRAKGIARIQSRIRKLVALICKFDGELRP